MISSSKVLIAVKLIGYKSEQSRYIQIYIYIYPEMFDIKNTYSRIIPYPCIQWIYDISMHLHIYKISHRCPYFYSYIHIYIYSCIYIYIYIISIYSYIYTYGNIYIISLIISSLYPIVIITQQSRGVQKSMRQPDQVSISFLVLKVSINGGSPTLLWFIRENQKKLDDLGLPPSMEPPQSKFPVSELQMNLL